MARASKTTTSTTINKHHFLFSFLYLSLIQIQSRTASSCLVFSILVQHIQNLDLSCIQWAGRRAIRSSVCLWFGGTDVLGDGQAVVSWSCVTVPLWPQQSAQQTGHRPSKVRGGSSGSRSFHHMSDRQDQLI